MVFNKSWLEIIGIFLAFLGLTFFFNTMSWTNYTVSDHAIAIILAEEFLNGNWLFHGWTFVTNSQTTTDLPFYIIGVLIRGFDSNLMHNIPAVTYALVVIVSSYLASQGFDSRKKWIVRIGVAIGLSMLGPWNTFLLSGPIHVAAILMILVSLLLLRSKNKLAEIIAYVIMAAAIIGDPLAIVIGPLPILLVITYNKIRKRKIENNTGYKLALKVIITLVAAEVIHYLIPILGGYNYDPMNSLWPIIVPTGDELIRNMLLLIQGIPTIYGSYFIGHQIDLVGIGYFARGILLVFLGYVIWKWLSKRNSFSFLDSVLVYGMGLVIVGFIFYVKTVPQTRYLEVIFIFGIILTARYMVKAGWTRRSVLVMGAIMTLIIITWIPSIPLSPVADTDFIILGNWLSDHQLYSGYGGYWNSNIVTVLSEGKVSIAPVIARGADGTISPFHLLSTVEWYESPQQPPRTFLVYDDSGWGAVHEHTAIKTWGEPSPIEKIKGFTILIWDHPIIPNPVRPE